MRGNLNDSNGCTGGKGEIPLCGIPDGNIVAS